MRNSSLLFADHLRDCRTGISSSKERNSCRFHHCKREGLGMVYKLLEMADTLTLLGRWCSDLSLKCETCDGSNRNINLS